MAEGLLRAFAGDRFEVYSAGTDPKGVHPSAIQAMEELGIDISAQKSEHIDTYLGSRLDSVITVCDRASSNCPILPGRTCLTHWSFDDPATAIGSEEERMAVFRRVRDEIAEALQSWLRNDAST